MARHDAAAVAVVSEKGQVVIPQSIRTKLGIRPKTKLLVYGYQDSVIMKKMEIPDVRKELEEIYRRVDKRIAEYGELSSTEINEVIDKYRRGKK
ncbi:MAG: AbrB/MazE/SpoVT family DNA-binding domain-containing protein [Conexivisphaerales archaeon]|jgi:AbrB family looped-hinge helix DNA binding protein